MKIKRKSWCHHRFKRILSLSTVIAISSNPVSCFFSQPITTIGNSPNKQTQIHLNEEKSTKGQWTEEIGKGAIESVTSIAENMSSRNYSDVRKRFYGTAPVYSNGLLTAAEPVDNNGKKKKKEGGKLTKKSRSADERIVISALSKLESDMQILDNLAGNRIQLSSTEFVFLSAAVGAAASAPFVFHDAFKITELLAPAAAAFSASIGITSEFFGKVAVADGKEVAAASIQCAAEAEGFLANAERTKAVIPLCVGIGATSATLSLLVPALVNTFELQTNIQLIVELYLFCPIVAVLAAAIASLALQETKSFSARAISVGNRRFAKNTMVGRSWLSTTEQIKRASGLTSSRWKSFAFNVIPAPLLGVLTPGTLPTKAIVVAAFAACQSAFFLSQAEGVLARATDAVAIKARSAAVCDTYANQGMRSAAILPFTSALSSLCAAATAAVVELPFVEQLASITAGGLFLQTAAVAAFPTLSSLFAAAATVSKARCEVDAEACLQAASTLALEYEDPKSPKSVDNDPVLKPFRGVLDLIRITFYGVRKIVKRSPLGKLVRNWLSVLDWRNSNKDENDNNKLVPQT